MSDLEQNATPQTESTPPLSPTEPVATTDPPQETPEEDASTQVIEELRSALAQSETREKDLQDKHLRLHAEFDNYRRRTAREQIEIIETANAKLLTLLSEVLDNFDRAFSSENKTNADSFEKGMQLIHDQFLKVLTDSGLESIDPVGQEFDPTCQEAFLKQPSETVTENHVVTVFQKGYKLKNKILKTAKVIVSAGK
ncbi:MAG TPA: nucleotide exchange factor GrpE [Fibrobacteraceae bacterium]|nr:nucleotide exchange factor GrpE [Fibrobacteraceae bacterium]